MFTADGTALIIEIIIGIGTILSGIAFAIKWLTKHYFDEIRAELKPNSGSSIKDQVTRLESRVNEADQMRRDMNSKLDKMYMILLDHVAKNKE
jgi:hypothetical protein